MRLIVHLILGLMDKRLRERISLDSALGGRIDVTQFRFPIDSESSDFLQIVDLAMKLDLGLYWTPWIEYSTGELRECRWFEIWPRKRVFESEADRQVNQSRFNESVNVETLPGLFVRIQPSIRLCKIKLSSDSIGNLGENSMELIVGARAAEALSKASLRGYDLKPIETGRNGEVHADFWFLFTNNFLPCRANRDLTIVGDERILESAGGLRRLGSLSYLAHSIPLDSDAFRTAEGWHGGQPLWIVSRRFTEIFKVNSLKGLSFRPVLSIDTPLYRRYRECFERLFSLMAENSKNRLW